MQAEKLNTKQEEEVNIPQNKYDQIVTTSENVQKSIKKIIARCDHEKKKVLFKMYTVRKLRNISKMRDTISGSDADRFMLVSCLLLKEGLLVNRELILKLSESTEPTFMGINNFQHFKKCPYNSKVIEDLLEDQSMYTKFQDLQDSKFSTEVKNQSLVQIYEKTNTLEYKDLQYLHSQMNSYFVILKDSVQGYKLKGSFMNTIYKGLTHFYYCLNEEKFFPADSSKFDWNTFEHQDKSVTDWEKTFNSLF